LGERLRRLPTEVRKEVLEEEEEEEEASPESPPEVDTDTTCGNPTLTSAMQDRGVIHVRSLLWRLER